MAAQIFGAAGVDAALMVDGAMAMPKLAKGGLNLFRGSGEIAETTSAVSRVESQLAKYGDDIAELQSIVDDADTAGMMCSLRESDTPIGMSHSVPSFDELKDLARNTLDFSTPKDGAVFWATPNMTKAQTWARLNRKFTVELTSGGRYLTDLELFEPGSPLTGKQASEVWDIASDRFSKQASGETFAFSTGAKRMNDYGSIRTWWRIERPNLISNPEVTNITRMKIDGTRAKTGHWSR